MPARAPSAADMNPRHMLLPTGTNLWRMHDRDFLPTEFKATPAHPYFDGGRFDATPHDPYPYLYVALNQETAVAEGLLRNALFDVDGFRFAPLAAIERRILSSIRTRTELRLISLLSAVDLATVGQDNWLVEADGPHYALIRFWSGELRRASPDAHGLIWQSRRDRPHHSIVLFGDRCPIDALGRASHGAIDLGTPDGAEWLNELMAPYRFGVA
jgi:hypothetical protein